MTEEKDNTNNNDPIEPEPVHTCTSFSSSSVETSIVPDGDKYMVDVELAADAAEIQEEESPTQQDDEVMSQVDPPAQDVDNSAYMDETCTLEETVVTDEEEEEEKPAADTTGTDKEKEKPAADTTATYKEEDKPAADTTKDANVAKVEMPVSIVEEEVSETVSIEEEKVTEEEDEEEVTMPVSISEEIFVSKEGQGHLEQKPKPEEPANTVDQEVAMPVSINEDIIISKEQLDQVQESKQKEEVTMPVSISEDIFVSKEGQEKQAQEPMLEDPSNTVDHPEQHSTGSASDEDDDKTDPYEPKPPIGFINKTASSSESSNQDDQFTAISSVGVESARQAAFRRREERSKERTEFFCLPPPSIVENTTECRALVLYQQSSQEGQDMDDTNSILEGGAAIGNGADADDDKPASFCLSFLRMCSNSRAKLEVTAIMLSLVAFVLTGSAMDRCDFVHVENAHLQAFWDMPTREVGLAQFETITHECTYWFENHDTADLIYDELWQSGRLITLTATCLGLIMVGFLCTQSCITYSAALFERLAYMSLIIPLLFGLSFIVLGSEACANGTCTLGVGGLVMILGIISWFNLSIVLSMMPDARMPQAKDSETASRRRRNAQFIPKRPSLYLAGAIAAVIVGVAVIDISVIVTRGSADHNASSADPTSQAKTDLGWVQAGEATLGPYPDTQNFISLSGDASTMSMIGKESVLVMEYDNLKSLWYPRGGMVPANMDAKAFDLADRLTKTRATSASLSENGQVIAVGSTNWAQANEDGKTYDFGSLQMWQSDPVSKEWNPVGHSITGKSKGDDFAHKVSMSQDGKHVAVLALGHYGASKPYVKVYQFNSVHENLGDWVQIGNDMELETTWVPSGFAFSGDGSTLALGSLRAGKLGLVNVWKYKDETATWERFGSTLVSDSKTREDQFGDSLALSQDGSILVVGDPGGLPAYARIFRFQGGNWNKLGQDLECNLGGSCAHDVAISNYGSVVAITGWDSYQMARVYTLSETESLWIPVGADILGEEPQVSVQSTTIEMSGDGQNIAFGILSQQAMARLWRYAGSNFEDYPLQGHATEEQAAEPVEYQESWVEPASIPDPLPATSVPTDENSESSTMEFSAEMDSAYNTSQSQPVQESNPTASQNVTALPSKPWVMAKSHGNVYYFLYDYLSRLERYDMNSKMFLQPINLPSYRGPATSFGINENDQLYVAYGNDVYRYSLTGTDELNINAGAETEVIDFQFDGDIVFINAGKFFISVDGELNTQIKKFFSYSTLVKGTSISVRHKRIFGRTPDEVGMVSGEIIRRSTLGFREYDQWGDFVGAKAPALHQDISIKRASKTWVFPDQTRVVDDQGYVFSVSGAEHVYSIETPEILDLAWLGGEIMIALHPNGSLTAISQELVTTGSHTFDISPANIAIGSGEVVAFTHDAAAANNGIRVDTVKLGLLLPSLPGRLINATDLPYHPSFAFVGTDEQLYMMSKAHASIFVMHTPEEQLYNESIKLAEIPKFVTYSTDYHEIYTLRHNGVLSKIDLKSENRSETPITTMLSTPLGLSTAGKFVFVCDESGNYATHFTFKNDGSLVSSVDYNHIDQDYVWNEANSKLYFFRQADPTDLMTEYISENGTIGERVDSFLNSNSGFIHPIRVDPLGEHAILGSGVIHDARTLQRLDVSLANSVDDIAFAEDVILTIRQKSEDAVELQQWDKTSFQLRGAREIEGRAHRLLSLGTSKTVVLTTDAVTGVPVAYVVE